jgi:hypothetical protein
MKIVRLIKMCLSEIYSRSHMVKNVPDAFPIQNGLNQGDGYCHCFSILFYNVE